MKFKKGQIVYFYRQLGEFEGYIVSGKIISALKDLTTGKITYRVKASPVWGDVWSFMCDREYDLTADSLYADDKKIKKEYREELLYGQYTKRLDEIERLLRDVLGKVSQPYTVDKFQTLAINGEKSFSTLYINADNIKLGEKDLGKEIEGIKKDISKLKKQIKQKTKKPVIEKKEETEEPKEEEVQTYDKSN